MKADLHIHSCYSHDSRSSLEDIITCSQQKGLKCIAVCDHGTVEGALRIQEEAPFTVIVGEEILTPAGEIMGLFLRHTIPSGISALGAIEEIKKQGGLVCLPHPFDRFRRSAVKEEAIEEIIPQVDVIETFNGHTLPLQDLGRPRKLALRYGLPQGAGSDAHSPSEIGSVYVTMHPFHDQEEFLKSLREGKIHGHRTGLLRRIIARAGRWGRV